MMSVAAIWLSALFWALISGRAQALGYVSRRNERKPRCLAVGVYTIMILALVSQEPVR